MKAVRVHTFGGPEVLKVESDVPIPVHSETQVFYLFTCFNWHNCSKVAMFRFWFGLVQLVLIQLTHTLEWDYLLNCQLCLTSLDVMVLELLKKLAPKLTHSRLVVLFKTIFQRNRFNDLKSSKYSRNSLKRKCYNFFFSIAGRWSRFLFRSQRLLRRVRCLWIAFSVPSGWSPLLRPRGRSRCSLLHGLSRYIYQVYKRHSAFTFPLFSIQSNGFCSSSPPPCVVQRKGQGRRSCFGSWSQWSCWFSRLSNR